MDAYLYSVYDVLVARFRVARSMWQDNASVQHVAGMMGISEYHYCCCLVLSIGPLLLTITAASTVEPLDFKQAFTEAGA